VRHQDRIPAPSVANNIKTVKNGESIFYVMNFEQIQPLLLKQDGLAPGATESAARIIGGRRCTGRLRRLQRALRTYNFGQGRLTDHRINLTLYKLDKILAGDDLGDIIDALVAVDQANRPATLEIDAA
jgi:hypothetical protein